VFGRKRKLDDFTSEIEGHIQLEIERLLEQGRSEEEARATARRSFGNVMHAEERLYESGRWPWWDHFWSDLRYGARNLWPCGSWPFRNNAVALLARTAIP
jgi:hypothetical protein